MPQLRGSRRETDRKRASSETTADNHAPAAAVGAVAAAAPAIANENVNPNGGNCKLAMASNGVVEEITDGCCCPTGCIIGKLRFRFEIFDLCNVY